MAEDKLLKPTVLWAQRKEMILLTVKVQCLKDPDFKIHDTHMNFKVYGVGASGKNYYGFDLVFNDTVNTERCRMKVCESEIEFRLLKQNPGEWSKLQSTHVKPHWIKIDFDHFEISDNETEDEEKQMEKQMKQFEEDTRKQLEIYGKLLDVGAKVQACCLVVYNVVQFLGFLVVVSRLLFLLVFGWDGITRAYSDVFPLLMACQGLALLEIVFILFGLVKGGVMSSIIQVGGRCFILLAVLNLTESIQESVVVYVLFLVWSLIELVRYPYYALSVLNKDIKWITWLRYTLWIPLYPVGLTCEFTVIAMSIIYGPAGGGWHYSLPNPLNISLSINALKLLALVLFPYISYMLISHMAYQRMKKLPSKKKRT